MSKIWKESEVQSYIDNFIEESLTLDYKAADALAMSDGKKKEITKDVSAMANSAGGIIIYGLKEPLDPAKKHFVEAIDPVDRTHFTKEWLEQNINNIRPRIEGIIIHSVSLASGANDVAYVVEIPQSNTAHQATDHRYYKRYNFQSIPMEDHEIRDVMNRLTIPEVTVDFTFTDILITSEKHTYFLEPIIKNLGKLVVNNYKLRFSIPRFVDTRRNPRVQNVKVFDDRAGRHITVYQSTAVLFPEEEFNIGDELQHEYDFVYETFYLLDGLDRNHKEPMVIWTLYADNMPPKNGETPLRNIQKF